LGKALALLRYLAKKEKSIQEFFSDLRDSYCPMDDNTSADEYDGVVMSTVHQAKGLEFDNVLIADDFRWKVIIAANMRSAIHCDEANILYVAITRSKCNLYLTQRASECLNYLSSLSPTIQLHQLPSLKSNEKKFEVWKRKWESFKKNSGHFIGSINDVVFPPDWDNNLHPLALHPQMSSAEQRRKLMEYLRSYHPDKFFPRFGDAIQSIMVRGEIKKVLEEITRQCTEILSSLRAED